MENLALFQELKTWLNKLHPNGKIFRTKQHHECSDTSTSDRTSLNPANYENSNSIISSVFEFETESFIFSGSVCEGEGSTIAQALPRAQGTPATQLPTAGTPSRPSFDVFGQTLFKCAEKNLYLEARQLIESGEDINGVAANDYTPLHIAANNGFLELVRLFLSSGANPNLHNYMKRTPLHLAAIRGHREIVEALLQNGANIDAPDIDSSTALHFVAEHGHAEVLPVLFEFSPKLTVKNRFGKMPVEIAVSREIGDMIQRYSEISTPKIPDIRDHNAVSVIQIGNGADPQAYDVLKLLGKGSFGEVFLVRKRDSNELYALKALQKAQVKRHNLVRYAMTERNVLSCVRHPFIVGLNFAFQTDEKLCLVLDYCPGGDLYACLNKEKRFTERRTMLYSSELVCALEELHKRDIVFRDLKPENVVLDKEGHARLTDFGLSREGMSGDTIATSFCGSPAYLAPEMLTRYGHGKQVDWYLLGVLIYEMLTGTPPYFSNNKRQLFWNIQHARLKMPKNLSTNAKDLIKRLLERDPNKRLGKVNDAEEIKEHPFFTGVNWGSVYARKNKLPIPKIPEIPKEGLNPERAFGEISHYNQSRLSNWTFVNSIV